MKSSSRNEFDSWASFKKSELESFAPNETPFNKSSQDLSLSTQYVSKPLWKYAFPLSGLLIISKSKSFIAPFVLPNSLLANPLR